VNIILVVPARTGKQEKCILRSDSLPLRHTVAYHPPSTKHSLSIILCKKLPGGETASSAEVRLCKRRVTTALQRATLKVPPAKGLDEASAELGKLDPR
jgi:hypothetical protein